MTLLHFIRLIYGNIRLLLIAPMVAGGIVWMLTTGQPKEYRSETTIYTGLVSGYTIESEQDRRPNHLLVDTGFDNLINMIRSNETLTEVALRLIDQQISGQNNFGDEFKTAVLPLVSDGAFVNVDLAQNDASRFEVLKLQARDPNTQTYRVLFEDISPFNVDEIDRQLTVTRVGVSDLLSLVFASENPAFAQTALALISETFMRKFRELKKREASSVVGYFASETESAYARLQQVVGEMKTFGTENRIINYYEQTKYIASQKEMIDQQIQQEKMQLAAARSAFDALEQKLGDTSAILDLSNDVLLKQDALSRLTTTAALKEAVGEDQSSQRKEIEELNASLTATISDLYQANHSSQGIAKEQLVAEWLVNLLEALQREASLDVLIDRRQGYQNVYDDFAPLGATLSSLEREVGIAEREYLELLHSLNQAKLRQQSIELAANLEVVDPPNIPVKPEPSKVSLLIMLAALTAVTVVMGGLILVDTLDQTLQSPSRAEDLTGIPMGTALPVPSELEAHPEIERILGKQLLSRIAANRIADRSDAPNLAVVCARKGDESVRRTADLLAGALRQTGQLVEHVVSQTDDSSDIARVAAQEGDRSQLETLDQRLQAEILSHGDTERTDWIVLEVPNLIESVMPVETIGMAQAVLFVAKADRIWSASHRSIAELVRDLNPSAMLMVLTNVQPVRLEEFIGDWPRKRGRIRSFVKRLVQFEFQA
jgi:uncharacterized protein involved in exopolysaccharide biosynthesis